MSRLLIPVFLILPFLTKAQFDNEQEDTTWKSIYRATAEKKHDLIHTKLDVTFDFPKAYLYGKEWLTLQPHFYETDSVILDAKGMLINKVSLVKGTTQIPLNYDYSDSMQLRIKLDKTYTKNEKITLYFEYTSRPNELKAEGSAAITDAKGLYFINPKGDQKNKPTQVWTQGETESNSAWMITIDKPNQKSTEEITMTVPDKYVTLSNGLLISQKKNANGTRSDYWKMDLPHAPYLFFMGAGEFSVIKDQYKGKEVSYYVEKEYAPYARGIFGLTPEMIACYSKLTGVEYPWPKYSQIVGRDFVSGAMENTTATLHQESAYQNNRELADGNGWEETIAHELFHHWFGDLVTTESWSNITLNESFANYGEYLWLEYKYGKEKADEHNYEDKMGYLMSGSEEKDLVRYHYSSREDVFDQVSYPKGGRILHMLRNYVGDSAFFKSLNLYLTQNRFKSAEVSQLRLAFEEVTGKDLHWYFNQWYYGNGHPSFSVNYAYNDTAGTATVTIEQTQKTGKIFKLPIAVDVYESGKRKRYDIMMENAVYSLTIPYKTRPELINVDADKTLLAQKKDKKTTENYQAQWKYARNYMDKREALEYFASSSMPELSEGLKDKFDGIQLFTLQKMTSSVYRKDSSNLATAEGIVKSKMNGKLRAAALNFLVKTGDKKYRALYEKYANDSSYSVAGAAVKGLMDLSPDSSYYFAKKYCKDAKGMLGKTTNESIMKKGMEEDFDLVANYFDKSGMNDSKFNMLKPFADYLKKMQEKANIKKGADVILNFRSQIPAQYREYTNPMFEKVLKDISDSKGEEIKTYIEEKLK